MFTVTVLMHTPLVAHKGKREIILSITSEKCITMLTLYIGIHRFLPEGKRHVYAGIFFICFIYKFTFIVCTLSFIVYVITIFILLDKVLGIFSALVNEWLISFIFEVTRYLQPIYTVLKLIGKLFKKNIKLVIFHGITKKVNVKCLL
ncbi:Uncharacterised protein [Serratia fonticola]|nr:Uncharacterised protein [Serratia fonticola]